ncbi:MAG TPA: hypothetical protein PKE40_11690 [Arachnia sp.]|nr:hypothetical protein [Arachnia sp.]HMT87007.1 hypothetical protein [Arachnia sp.]
MKTLRRLLAAILLALVAVGAGVLPALAAPPVVPDDAGELVGVAFDPSSGTLWLAGGRADDGVLLGLGEDGGQVEMSFDDDLVSVQALAFHGGQIYVGDVGDPRGDRDHVVVYRLTTTEPGKQVYQAFDFAFPDGPRNASAMMVSGRGRIYLVTDGEDPGIYAATQEPSRTEVNVLTRMAEAPAGVTDGAFLDDGSTMVLRTAQGIQVIDAFTWETQAVETLVGAAGDEVLAVLPGDELLVGSAAGLRQSPVPTQNMTTTVEAASPAGDAETSAGATESPGTETPSGSSAPARTGTLVAVILAVLVAVAAGASTLLWRD